jgi:hypothetical protein
LLSNNNSNNTNKPLFGVGTDNKQSSILGNKPDTNASVNKQENSNLTETNKSAFGFMNTNELKNTTNNTLTNPLSSNTGNQPNKEIFSSFQAQTTEKKIDVQTDNKPSSGSFNFGVNKTEKPVQFGAKPVEAVTEKPKATDMFSASNKAEESKNISLIGNNEGK